MVMRMQPVMHPLLPLLPCPTGPPARPLHHLFCPLRHHLHLWWAAWTYRMAMLACTASSPRRHASGSCALGDHSAAVHGSVWASAPGVFVPGLLPCPVPSGPCFSPLPCSQAQHLLLIHHLMGGLRWRMQQGCLAARCKLPPRSWRKGMRRAPIRWYALTSGCQ